MMNKLINRIREKGRNLLARRRPAPAAEASASPVEDTPTEFRGDILIDAPRARVFELLDFAAPGHHLRERGFAFTEEGGVGAGEVFRARTDELDGVTFVFAVEHYQAPCAIAFKASMEGETPIGNLLHSRSVYVLHEVGPDRTRVELVELPCLPDDLSPMALAQETAILSVSVTNELAKLKAQAEGGPEAGVAMDDLAFDRKVA